MHAINYYINRLIATKVDCIFTIFFIVLLLGDKHYWQSTLTLKQFEALVYLWSNRFITENIAVCSTL